MASKPGVKLKSFIFSNVLLFHFYISSSITDHVPVPSAGREGHCGYLSGGGWLRLLALDPLRLDLTLAILTV